MSDVDVMLRLPETLVEKARAQGLLSNERMSRLLAAEIERIEAWSSLNRTLEPAREAFRADHRGMSEDEVMAMLNGIIEEVRAEDVVDKNDTEVS
jgi:hypothetical protein